MSCDEKESRARRSRSRSPRQSSSASDRKERRKEARRSSSSRDKSDSRKKHKGKKDRKKEAQNRHERRHSGHSHANSRHHRSISSSSSRSRSRSRSASPFSSRSDSRSPSPSPSRSPLPVPFRLPTFDRQSVQSSVSRLLAVAPRSRDSFLFVFFRLDAGEIVSVEEFDSSAVRDELESIFRLLKLEELRETVSDRVEFRIPRSKVSKTRESTKEEQDGGRGSTNVSYKVLPAVEEFFLAKAKAGTSTDEPESIQAERKAKELFEVVEEEEKPSERRIIGPAMPSPEQLAQIRSNRSLNEEEKAADDDDDGVELRGGRVGDEETEDAVDSFGPRALNSLSASETAAYEKLQAARAKALATRAAIAAIRQRKTGQSDTGTGQEREEWLTQLPSASSAQSSLLAAFTSGNQSAMKNRAFKLQNRAAESGSATVSDWAVSPAERELIQIQIQLEKEAAAQVEQAQAEMAGLQRRAQLTGAAAAAGAAGSGSGSGSGSHDTDSAATPNSSARAAQLASQRMLAKLQPPPLAFPFNASSSSSSSSTPSAFQSSLMSSSSSGSSLLELHQRRLAAEKEKRQMTGTGPGTLSAAAEPYHWDREKEFGLRRQKTDSQIRSEISSAWQLNSRFH